jgi:DNA-binding protein H-NS
MVTAEEIRARVEAADKDRIQARAETAAKIAADIDKRTKVLAELAEVDAAIAAGLAESTAIMTLAELSAFTGIAVSDLAPGVAPAPGGRGGRQPRRKAAGARKSRAVVASGATPPVAVSSDF